MAEPKPFASLSSGLLARKGGAKPAMRPQSFGQMGMGLEDLGWNDMGYSHAPAPEQVAQTEHVPSSIAALTPAPRHNGHSQPTQEHKPIVQPAPEEAPPVVEQQRAVAAAFAPKPTRRVRSVPKPTAAARERKAPGAKAKAAFTLRLDPDRHLKLRLACAVTHRSAQQIVTEAVDAFLASLPEIDAIASQMPGRPAGKRN